MVKRKKELWVRCGQRAGRDPRRRAASSGGAFPTTMWGLPFVAFFLFSRRSWADGVGTRRTDGGPPIVVAGRRIPPPAVHRFGGDAVRLRGAQGPLHAPTSRSPSRRAPRHCGPRSIRTRREPLPRNRIGTIRRRRRASWGFSGSSGGPELRQLRIGVVVVDRCVHRLAVVVVLGRQQFQRRWRWRRRRRRRRWLVVSSLLVLVLVLAGAGARRLRAGLQQDSHRLTSGCPRRCRASTSS